MGINANRPITRQRFSAALELCHHLRDADKQITCPIGSKNDLEKFVEGFAAALLMPVGELRKRATKYGPEKVRKQRHMNYRNIWEMAVSRRRFSQLTVFS